MSSRKNAIVPNVVTTVNDRLPPPSITSSADQRSIISSLSNASGLSYDVAVSSENLFDAEESSVDESKKASRPYYGGGMPVSKLWALFTTDKDPQKQKSCQCKYCDLPVATEKKTERIVAHLVNRCTHFENKLMHFKEFPDGFLKTAIETKFKREWDKFHQDKTQIAELGFVAKRKSSLIETFVMPKMQESEIVKCNILCAMAVATSGQSFRTLENPFLKKMMEILRPDFAIPDRRLIAGRLLHECYMHTKSGVDARMGAAKLTLITDGWSNINSDPIVNYVAHNAVDGFYLESIATGKDGHTAQWLADDLTRVINKYPHSFVGVVTDNTAANKSAWRILEAKFPSMMFYGCISHGLHLLVKSIFAIEKQKRIHSCFKSFSDLAENCTEIANTIKKSHNLKAIVEEEQRIRRLPTIKAFCITRWGGVSALLKSVLESEAVLRGIFTNPSFLNVSDKKKREKRQKLHDIVVDKQFQPMLKTALKILEPIDLLITKYQSDKIPISDVYNDFELLKSLAFVGIPLSVSQKTKIKELIDERWEFMYNIAHGIGYLLDPRYTDGPMNPTVRYRLKMSMVDYFIRVNGSPTTATAPEEREAITNMILNEYDDFAKFVEDHAPTPMFKTMRDRCKAQGSSVLKTFWFENRHTWPSLHQIGNRIFSLVCTSASVERSFSTMGFFHSKLRSRLQTNTVHMLTYIKTNQKFFDLDDIYSTYRGQLYAKKQKRNHHPSASSRVDNNSFATAETTIGTVSNEIIPTNIIPRRNNNNKQSNNKQSSSSSAASASPGIIIDLEGEDDDDDVVDDEGEITEDLDLLDALLADAMAVDAKNINEAINDDDDDAINIDEDDVEDGNAAAANKNNNGDDEDVEMDSWERLLRN
jgi:hypothetical protein